MFKLFKKTEKTKFELLFLKIDSNLSKGNFNKALADYALLSDEYANSSLEDKEKFDDLYFIMREQLTLYMKIKELLLLIKGEDLDLIRIGLDTIFEVRPKLNGNNKLMNFIDKYYVYCQKIYRYKLAKKQFNNQLSEVYHLLREESFESALEEHRDLIFYFNEMDKYSSKSTESTYKKIIELKDHIKIRLLESRAYSTEAKYTKVKKKKKR
ncbi:hypothetical protein HOD61_03260 [archaeon]|jgi:hypothetical protein|nr:hypothetical protein [archaeon]